MGSRPKTIIKRLEGHDKYAKVIRLRCDPETEKIPTAFGGVMSIIFKMFILTYLIVEVNAVYYR